MKVGDLVYGQEFPSMRRHVGVIVDIHVCTQYNKKRYMVYFGNPPNPGWNDGAWSEKALELV